MTLAHNIIGIDISKAWLDLFDADIGRFSRLANTPAAVQPWAQALPAGTLVVLEATGIYDRTLRHCLADNGIGYARLNPKRPRDFARSTGQLAKTDRLDARMLAQMGRALELTADTPVEPAREELAELDRRRDQLVDMRTREANHAESADPAMRDSIARHIDWLDAEIGELASRIKHLIQTTAELERASTLLRSAPGIGQVVGPKLLAMLPELGKCSGKAIAALAGLAPLNNDSGTMRGTRHIGAGRKGVRKALYMAAITAARCNSRFRAAYEALRDRGKPAKLAYIAIARKLVVTLNAMLKSQTSFAA